MRWVARAARQTADRRAPKPHFAHQALIFAAKNELNVVISLFKKPYVWIQLFAETAIV